VKALRNFEQSSEEDRLWIKSTWVRIQV
jgi:hypothetical protein